MIRDEQTGWVEADITINGVKLIFPEAMTLRVAISTFLMQLSSPEMIKDLGPVAEGYTHHASSIQSLIHAGRRR